MVISIKKLKEVIEELHTLEKNYKQKADGLEMIVKSYRSLTQEGADRRALQRILEEFRQEIRSLQKLRRCLGDIVNQYEKAEVRVIQFSETEQTKSSVFRRINTEEVRRILDDYHIKIQ